MDTPTRSTGNVGPRPGTGCPRPFEFVRAEFPVARLAVGHEEPIEDPGIARCRRDGSEHLVQCLDH
jgi:hypothetical protein